LNTKSEFAFDFATEKVNPSSPEIIFVLKNKGIYSSRNLSLKKIQAKSAWRSEVDQIYKPLITTLSIEAHFHKSVLG